MGHNCRSPTAPRQAVHLLSISKQFDRAVQLCAEHDVQITEDMAERMTPEKTLGTVGCWGWVDLLYSDIIILWDIGLYKSIIEALDLPSNMRKFRDVWASEILEKQMTRI